MRTLIAEKKIEFSQSVLKCFFFLQGFTYVAPSVLEELNKPWISEKEPRSPRKLGSSFRGEMRCVYYYKNSIVIVKKHIDEHFQFNNFLYITRQKLIFILFEMQKFIGKLYYFTQIRPYVRKSFEYDFCICTRKTANENNVSNI